MAQNAESATPSRRLERAVNATGAVLLLLFSLLWFLTLSHMPPARLVLPSCLLMAAAIGCCFAPQRFVNNAGFTIACLIMLIWVASTYRLPRNNPGAPWIELSSIPMGGVTLALLTAAAGTFLWTRFLNWLAVAERARFVLFLVGLLPLLLVSADLAYVGKGRLQPLRPPNYHPFLTYPVEESYGFRHATEAEVTDMTGVRFRQRKPDDVIRVVLCGASTVWGWGLKDPEESLPKVFQAELAKRYPDQKIEVLTIAFPGKFQLNELIDATVTLPHWQPDVVISLNGFNEIWYGEETNRFEGMPYIEAQMRTRGTMACLFTRFSHIGAQYFALNRDREKPPYRLEKADADLGPRYEYYLRETAAGLHRHGIPYVYAFCPNIEEKASRSEKEATLFNEGGDWVGKPPVRRAKAIEILAAEQQHSYDVMAPLNESGETLFLDECHLNAAGVRLLASDLAERLPKWCERLRSNDAPKR